jgi:acetylornithine/N-succinyldiaminopimelate aminotransferase
MAVGNAVLDVVTAPGFLDEVRRKGLLFKQRLAAVVDGNSDLVAEVRGEGMMLGVRCVVPAGEVIAAMRDEHMLAIGAGENVVRFLPPLIATDEDIGEALARTERALARVRAAQGARGAAE